MNRRHFLTATAIGAGVSSIAMPAIAQSMPQIELLRYGGASGSGGPSGKRNWQYRHGERTKASIAKRQKFSALLKMLRAGLT